MSTSKYIRPMSFGELIRSTLQMFLKTLWPFWVIIILITFAVDLVFLIGVRDVAGETVTNTFLLALMLLPAFFIGPAMLTISNIILARPKKTWESFRKGMSLGMILKIFLFFLPVLAIILIVTILGLVIEYFPWLYLIFTVPLLLFAPIWVFYPMILLLEKKGVRESVRRTRIFIAGQFKRLLQIQILLVALTALLTPLGVSYYRWAYQLEPVTADWTIDFSGQVFGASWGYADRISGGLYYILPLTLGLAITAYVLHYYQVRAQKENFSEELLAQELGYQPIEEMMTV